jgi:hypothetical protein
MIAASAGIAKGKFALACQKPDRQGGPDAPALIVKEKPELPLLTREVADTAIAD